MCVSSSTGVSLGTHEHLPERDFYAKNTIHENNYVVPLICKRFTGNLL